MNQKMVMWLLLVLMVTGILVGCGDSRQAGDSGQAEGSRQAGDSGQAGSGGRAGDPDEDTKVKLSRITPDTKIEELEEGLSVVRYEGDYGFQEFLEQGGADSDAGVVEYVGSRLSENIPGLLFGGNPFGCSTISVENQDGGYFFGRNFDWNSCNALIISAKPEQGYASVSTVNMDFIQAGGMDISKLPDSAQAAIGLYAPLDGMNEMGLAVSVNMIDDSARIEQDTHRPGLTTTTAVRLLLDQAANVEEALELLGQYDLHGSMGMMIHFALADAEGNSVVVEYVNNERVVNETPVVTNFYLAKGGKYGVGSSQSHIRYDMLQEILGEQGTMTLADVREALDSVSKDNFGEFESTEWSIVMDQEKKELTYFHRENYTKGYTVAIG